MASNALFDELKAAIYQTAEETPAIGVLEESLKWGEPSFTPKKKNVGSSVRLAQRDGSVAMMFICTTKLVDRFREIYPDDFNFEGGRALVFNEGETVPRVNSCDAFAQNAVEVAKKVSNCRYSGGRWSANYAGHKKWCMSVSDAVVANEDKIRAECYSRCLIGNNFGQNGN